MTAKGLCIFIAFTFRAMLIVWMLMCLVIFFIDIFFIDGDITIGGAKAAGGLTTAIWWGLGSLFEKVAKK